MNKIILVCLFTVFSLIQSHAAEPLKFNGDFRLRFDHKEETQKRSVNRFRARARIGATTALSDVSALGFQVATGSGAPNTNNQTLGDGFSFKNIYFRKFYYSYEREDIRFLAGKYENPFFRALDSQLIWDSDLTPEGFHLTYNPFDFLFSHSAVMFAEERSTDSDDYLLSQQFGLQWKDFSSSEHTLALTWYHFTSTADKAYFYSSTNSYGNSSSPRSSNQYDNDYSLVNLSYQYKMMYFSFPVTLGGDLVKNMTIGEDNLGFLVGVKTEHKIGDQTLSLGYSYRKVEKDSTIGLFTDSDFKGGGTDTKGHQISASYKFNQTYSLSLNQMFSKTSLESTGKNYAVTLVDLSAKF